MTALVFLLSRLSGDPRYLMLNEYATPEDFRLLGEKLGLDKPIYVQYAKFVAGAAMGNLGESMQARQPVLKMILDRAPGTLQLAGTAYFLIILASTVLVIVTALGRDTWVDRIGKGIAVLGQSVPAFWLGIMLILVFAVQLGWFPTAGRGTWRNLVLPAFTIAANSTAAIMRLLRSAMLDALDAEYVKFARLKGVGEPPIVLIHCLKNAALIPFTYAGIVLGQLLTGSIIVETVFGWPGLGLLALQAVQTRDYPLLQGVVLMFALIYVCIAFVVDLAYLYLDPRTRV
jgi:peptide/nickel transport system permease protein